MPTPQTYKNHTRFDPAYHFVLMPLLLLNFGFAIYKTIHDWPAHPHLNVWWIVMAFAFILLALKARSYAVKAQDRVIRLEEQLRLVSILPRSDHSVIARLTPAQLIALRFAPDEELAALALQAASQKLAPKAIKQSIVNWRADYHRI
jgi:hypothetical protein